MKVSLGLEPEQLHTFPVMGDGGLFFTLEKAAKVSFDGPPFLETAVPFAAVLVRANTYILVA